MFKVLTSLHPNVSMGRLQHTKESVLNTCHNLLPWEPRGFLSRELSEQKLMFCSGSQEVVAGQVSENT